MGARRRERVVVSNVEETAGDRQNLMRRKNQSKVLKMYENDWAVISNISQWEQNE